MFIQTLSEALTALRTAEAHIAAGERESAEFVLAAVGSFISQDTTRRTATYNRVVGGLQAARMRLSGE